MTDIQIDEQEGVWINDTWINALLIKKVCLNFYYLKQPIFHFLDSSSHTSLFHQRDGEPVCHTYLTQPLLA